MADVMKSIAVKLSLALIFLLSFTLFLYSESDKCSKITIEIIKKNIPVSDFKILSSKEEKGICEIIINVKGRIIPLYGNENYLISGDMFQNKKNVTSEKLIEITRKMFFENKKDLDEAVAFEYKPAVIKSEMTVYMFTEPLCSYCHKAGPEVKKLADEYGFIVKIVLVSMSGEEGRKKSIEAACRHYKSPEVFNFEQYNQIEWKKEKTDDINICEKGTELINKTDELTEKMGIDGVPSFFTNKGDNVSGADLDALKRLIEQK